MKKVLSIVFAVLILLAGMHLSIAAHLCGGEVASVKLSFSGQEATCEMEMPTACPVHNELTSSGCCKNRVSYYSVDENYSTSSFDSSLAFKKITIIIASILVSPQHSLIHDFRTYTNNGPPDEIASAVYLQDICVFRI